MRFSASSSEEEKGALRDTPKRFLYSFNVNARNGWVWTSTIKKQSQLFCAVVDFRRSYRALAKGGPSCGQRDVKLI